MIDVEQFRTLVVRPVLQTLSAYSPAMNTPAAENLLVGTAIQESHLTYLAQLGGGPALGVMQIEPNTHDDAWTNFINARSNLSELVLQYATGGKQGAQQLPHNLAYSVAMARIVYWRQQQPMPTDAGDLNALAQYWKDHYNTAGGAGTAQEWVTNYQNHAQKSEDRD